MKDQQGSTEYMFARVYHNVTTKLFGNDGVTCVHLYQATSVMQVCLQHIRDARLLQCVAYKVWCWFVDDCAPVTPLQGVRL